MSNPDPTMPGSTDPTMPRMPGNVCPNGQTAFKNPDENVNTNVCIPITCPTGYELTPDVKGNLGCAEPGKEPVICPSGTSIDLQAAANNGYICQSNRVNIDYSNWESWRPKFNEGLCPDNDPNWEGAYPENNNRDGACQYIPFKCPDSDTHGRGMGAFDQQNNPLCYLYSAAGMTMCPAGFKYSIDSSDLLTCTEISNYSNSDRGNCPIGYGSETDRNGNPNCIYGSSGSNQTSSNEPPLLGDTSTPPPLGDTSTPPPVGDTSTPPPVGDTSTPPQEPTIKTVVCPNGYTYSSMINGIMSCSKENQVSVSLECPTGYTYNGSTTEGGMICAPLQQFTSHVYEFKSKRGRTVETFSQNRNGKCKARY